MKEESGLLLMKSMDKKLATGELKTEFNNSMANSAFSDEMPASFDMQSFDSDMGFNYSCFMDILGSQDFTFSSSDLSDLFQPPLPPPVLTVDQSKPPVLSPATTFLESSEVVNTPATPNSSSISSSFNGGARQNEDLHKKKAIDGAEVEDPKETKKQMMKKPKKEKKKEREPRFAFRTKCEVDNLDDGYRWRKYGQKAVKNSPFPRSYYRCTTPQCDVKKRVERSVEDHTILVTTYEGTHTHPCPSTTTPRGGGVTAPVETPYSFLLGNATTSVSGLASGSTTAGGGYLPSIQYHQPQQYQQQQSFLGGEFASTFNFNTNNITNNSSLSYLDDLSTRLVEDQERRFSGPSSKPIFMDGGLLEDIVTPQMMKKPKVEYSSSNIKKL